MSKAWLLLRIVDTDEVAYIPCSDISKERMVVKSEVVKADADPELDRAVKIAF